MIHYDQKMTEISPRLEIELYLIYIVIEIINAIYIAIKIIFCKSNKGFL